MARAELVTVAWVSVSMETTSVVSVVAGILGTSEASVSGSRGYGLVQVWLTLSTRISRPRKIGKYPASRWKIVKATTACVVHSLIA